MILQNSSSELDHRSSYILPYERWDDYCKVNPSCIVLAIFFFPELRLSEQCLDAAIIFLFSNFGFLKRFLSNLIFAHYRHLALGWPYRLFRVFCVIIHVTVFQIDKCSSSVTSVCLCHPHCSLCPSCKEEHLLPHYYCKLRPLCSGV